MNRKVFIGKRSKYANSEAIIMISKYGTARVIEVTNNRIIEENIKFSKIKLDLSQMAYLAREIHQNEKNGLRLVHGDLSFNNTTLYNGDPKCFDYEHAHFGNIYVDLGRIILRVCSNIEEIKIFFKMYTGSLPLVGDLKKGLATFCDWQHKVRVEKLAPYSNVPLIRKRRVEESPENLEDVLNRFKAEVK